MQHTRAHVRDVEVAMTRVSRFIFHHAAYVGKKETNNDDDVTRGKRTGENRAASFIFKWSISRGLVYIRLHAQNTVLTNNFVICGTEASVRRVGPSA
jgi:hypothetical protein